MPEFGERFYEEEEAEQILRLASSMTSSIGAMSREELLRTAAELGISPQAVELAEKQVATSRAELSDRAEFDKVLRRDFYGLLASYVIVNGFLISLNLFLGGYFWAVWPLLGWGIGLAFQFVETFFRNTDSYQQAFEKWRRKRNRVESHEPSLNSTSDVIIERYIKKQVARGRTPTRMEAITYLCKRGELTLIEGRSAVDAYILRNPQMLE